MSLYHFYLLKALIERLTIKTAQIEQAKNKQKNTPAKLNEKETAFWNTFPTLFKASSYLTLHAYFVPLRFCFPNTQHMDTSALLAGFRGLKALVIGDVMIDSYLWGKAERISPEAPVPVVRVQRQQKRLGGAGNVALNLATLGAKPYLFAVTGEDEDAQALLALLEESKIEKSGILQCADRQTTVKHRILAGSQQLLRVDAEDDRLITEAQRHVLLQHILAEMDDAKVIIFEDYDKGVLSEPLIQAVIEEAKKRKIPTVVDPKKRNFFAYAGCTLFKPNFKELREGLKLGDFSAGDQNAVTEAATRLRERLKAEAVFVTLSEYGVLIQDKKATHSHPAHKREISDVSGAGDTVVSVASLALALGASLSQVAALANLGGGLVCEHLGVVPLSWEVLEKEALAKLAEKA